MLRRACLLAGLGLLVAVSGAFAQQQGRGGRGFGGFGFGPPGNLGLIGIPEVQKEIGVTDDQKKQIDELLASARNAGGGFQGLRDLSDEERQKRFEAMRKANEENEQKLTKILDGKQVARLDQLRLQREGVMAFNRPKVADELGLTAEQKEKISKIQADARPQGGRNFQDLSEEERRELRTKMQEQREKAQADTLAVLTDAQKAKWAEMKGKEFSFPAPGRGGRGGAGGNGGERQRPARSTNN
jgi:Spy/CpxP family protein refolding chaperone